MTGFYIDDIQDPLLDLMFGAQAAPTPPGTYYVALFTTMPAFDGTGAVEAAFSGYARVAVVNNLTQWPAAAAGAKVNANDVDYGVAGSGPTLVVGFGFYDHPTLATPIHLIAAVNVTGSPVTINNGATVKFPAGSIDLTRCA